jgi:hypothetical protein
VIHAGTIADEPSTPSNKVRHKSEKGKTPVYFAKNAIRAQVS